MDTANLKAYLESSQKISLDKVKKCNNILFNFNIFIIIHSPTLSAQSEFEVPLGKCHFSGDIGPNLNLYIYIYTYIYISLLVRKFCFTTHG